MSPAVAREFLPALRKVETELAVPIPDRVRILRELEYDLEQLRGRLIEQGLSAEEARVRALEALVPDGQTLRELRRLHAPAYARIMGRLGEERLTLIERTALAVVTGSVLLVESLILLRADLLGDPSPFLWPVLGIGGALFAAIAAKVFGLWIKRDHSAPERGLGTVLGLAVATLVTGVVGACVDLFVLASTLETAPELAGSLGLRWMVRDAALLSVSILLSLAGGLIWFVLTQWLGVVAQARRDVLGLEGSQTPRKAMTR